MNNQKTEATISGSGFLSFIPEMLWGLKQIGQGDFVLYEL